MAPYVPLLMPELQNALVDPLPEVRATAARALGSLVKGMGEQHFQGLMPWLLATLRSEVASTPARRCIKKPCHLLTILLADTRVQSGSSPLFPGDFACIVSLRILFC
jgi:hypothetical protein